MTVLIDLIEWLLRSPNPQVDREYSNLNEPAEERLDEEEQHDDERIAV
jgi:hypothetical protein